MGSEFRSSPSRARHYAISISTPLYSVAGPHSHDLSPPAYRSRRCWQRQLAGWLANPGSSRSSERRLVGLSRFELLTPRLSSVCSNQLSYRPGLHATCLGCQRTRLRLGLVRQAVPACRPRRHARRPVLSKLDRAHFTKTVVEVVTRSIFRELSACCSQLSVELTADGRRLIALSLERR